jgi:hypothetical protein
MEKFKSLRHMETVRNYLNWVVKELLNRGERHDQSKLEYLEADAYEKAVIKLRDLKYGSEEYMKQMEVLKPAIEHHHKLNRHHPEFFEDGIKGMNLIDLIEMICDWKAASLRHNDGDLMRSIEIGQERFGYSDELKRILVNTAFVIEKADVFHKSEES